MAHINIEPTQPWQTEIERALATMESLLAIHSPDFGGSRWCDQEVGIAIGYGRLVVPVRYGLDPYGFIGNRQALTPCGKELASCAGDVARLLLTDGSTRVSMMRALVRAFRQALSYQNAKLTMSMLETVTVVTPDQAALIAEAIQKNDQVRDAFGVPHRAKNLLGRLGHGHLAA